MMFTIYYVEDERFVREMVSHMLRDYFDRSNMTEWEVKVFCGGTPALEAIQHLEEDHQVRLLITDIDLRDNVSGLALAEEGAIQGIPGILVYATLAEDAQEHLKNSIESANNNIRWRALNKPAENKKLISTVESLLPAN